MTIPQTQPKADLANHTAGQSKTVTSCAQAGTVPSPLPVPTKPRSRRRSTTAHQTREMLKLLPVHATSVPRLHLEPRLPDGMLKVLDRFTGQQVIVYTPRFTQQFRAGHCSGQWYVRPVTHVGADPTSRSFTTAQNAVEGVRAGRWSLRSSAAAQRHKQGCVICPAWVPSRVAAS